MLLQIKGNVDFVITIDSSAWIFDDRKIHIEDLINEDEEINFDDSVEWNRQIIEGETLPPTLKSEKKYRNKKEELLNGTFLMALDPFLEYAEPKSVTYEITHKDGKTALAYKDRYDHYAQFSKDGQRLYEDGMVDLLVIKDGEIVERYEYVTSFDFV
ncbi:hypothetical protein [Nosocomiicoccus ampullae]|uniref:Uncharacterized protein n=1 Tax=Nosocomiicoccus ampullae TaxID=489910 RepID=A0A9Q2HFP9_9STAP|nr:hypothetical protein [Nosocomiicoccus ampullae]MBB5176126.1 hypothetical protein [Nosocomiicoccus ampullae]QYA47298.1 hypothetical protein KPF49_02320 [Nosocomiicoccus ampullae]